jgi:hypothetical protein
MAQALRGGLNVTNYEEARDKLKSMTNHTWIERYFNEDSNGVLIFVGFLMVKKL